MWANSFADEKDLRNLGTLAHSKVRPEFISGVDELIRYVFSKAQPKKILDTQISGPGKLSFLGRIFLILLAFVKLADQYIQAINKGAAPDILNSWDFIANDANHKAMETALNGYQVALKTIRASIPIPIDTLRTKNDERKSIAIKSFMDDSIGGITKTGPIIERMEVFLTSILPRIVNSLISSRCAQLTC